jgi:hypothetical protein
LLPKLMSSVLHVKVQFGAFLEQLEVTEAPSKVE